MFEPTLIYSKYCRWIRGPWPLRGAGRQLPSQGFDRASGFLTPRQSLLCSGTGCICRRQQKFFDLLGTHICMPLLYYHCNVGLEPRPTFFRFPMFVPQWIHISFTSLSLSPSCRRPVPLLEGPRGFPPSAKISTPPRWQCGRRPLTRRSRFTWLAKPKDGSGAGDALARPTRPPPPAPRRRGERRWGCDASASPGTDSVGRRGCIRPHCRPNAGEGGATIRRHRQPWTWRRCHPGPGRWAHAIQAFKTSARSSHRPSSPRQEGILTLKSFMIP